MLDLRLPRSLTTAQRRFLRSTSKSQEEPFQSWQPPSSCLVSPCKSLAKALSCERDLGRLNEAGASLPQGWEASLVPGLCVSSFALAFKTKFDSVQTISVLGKDTAKKVPDLESVVRPELHPSGACDAKALAQVIGTIARISRLQATMTIQTVDGALCADESDFQGVIRAQDVRQTDKDKVRIWHCFRPGDIVRATVLSLGDARSYYLTTARNDLGVVFATSAETGKQLEPQSWEVMRDAATGETEPRKVAGPPSSS